VLLLKMAHLELLLAHRMPAICLLDDFMTDLDADRISVLVVALKSLGSQLIFTTPLLHSPLTTALDQTAAQHIVLGQ
jgi:recombinational DNA repair ATPase RecF